MPAYTIEMTYTLPIFRHGTYAADTPEAACKTAIDDDNWESAKKDYDSSGEVHVTGIWEGENTAYAGSPITIPSQFDEGVQRRAHHFEILLGARPGRGERAPGQIPVASLEKDRCRYQKLHPKRLPSFLTSAAWNSCPPCSGARS